MRKLFAAFAALVAAVTGFGMLALATSADDQATADAAIVAFSERMTAAGWESRGPTELDEESANDDLFSACQQELAGVQSVFTGEFEGETAQNYSDEFVFVPEGGQPATTETFAFSADGEFAAAFVVSVDDDHRAELDKLVEMIGSPELVACIEQSIAEDMAPDSSTATSDALLEPSFEYTIENEADLGVGDSSASLNIAFGSDIMGEPFQFDTTLYFAQVDRTLVGVLTGSSGDAEPTSGFDPVEELTALAEDVGA